MAKESTDNQNSAQQLMDTNTLENGKKEKPKNKKKQTKESSKKIEKKQISGKSPNPKIQASGKRNEKEKEGRKAKKAAVITEGQIEEDRNIIVKRKKIVKPKNSKKKTKQTVSKDLNEQLRSTFNELGSILFQTSFRY